MPPVIPRATYRLQFHKDFGFDRATELAPYLARLGISHLYASLLSQGAAGQHPRLRHRRSSTRSTPSWGSRLRSTG